MLGEKKKAKCKGLEISPVPYADADCRKIIFTSKETEAERQGMTR